MRWKTFLSAGWTFSPRLICDQNSKISTVKGDSCLSAHIGFFDIRFSDLSELPTQWPGDPAVWVQPREHKLVGAVLAQARERAGLTQVQLAKLLRKPQSFVSSYERGQRRIDILEMVRIVEALKGNPKRVFADILRKR
jgi:hypothetical protein